jgi:hypothetical protein
MNDRSDPTPGGPGPDEFDDHLDDQMRGYVEESLIDDAGLALPPPVAPPPPSAGDD